MLKRMSIGLLVIAVATVTSAYAQGSGDVGVIMGKVVNGTDASIVYGGRDIELMIFSKGGGLQRERMKTDDSGNFTFRGIALGAEPTYVVAANYKNVPYYTGRIAFKESREAEVTLTVYETTATDEGIYIDSEHLIVNREPDDYRVTEIISVNNRGSRTYVGQATEDNKEAETLFFTLPNGYTELKLAQLIPSQFIRQKPQGFAILEPIYPGPMQLNFTYKLPATTMPMKLGKEVKYPTGNINVLYGDYTENVISDKLTNMGVMEFGGSKYLVLAGRNFTRASSFSITVKGGRMVSTWVRSHQKLLIAIFTIGLGSVLGVSMFIRGRSGESVEERAISPVGMEEQKKELIEYIAQLDDRFEAGELPRQEYEKDRREKKAQLLELMRMMGQGQEKQGKDSV